MHENKLRKDWECFITKYFNKTHPHLSDNNKFYRLLNEKQNIFHFFYHMVYTLDTHKLQLHHIPLNLANYNMMSAYVDGKSIISISSDRSYNVYSALAIGAYELLYGNRYIVINKDDSIQLKNMLDHILLFAYKFFYKDNIDIVELINSRVYTMDNIPDNDSSNKLFILTGITDDISPDSCKYQQFYDTYTRFRDSQFIVTSKAGDLSIKDHKDFYDFIYHSKLCNVSTNDLYEKTFNAKFFVSVAPFDKIFLMNPSNERQIIEKLYAGNDYAIKVKYDLKWDEYSKYRSEE